MISKPKKPTLIVFSTLGGMAYFNLLSSVTDNPLLESYLVLAPIAVGILVYLKWFRSKKPSINSPEN